MLPTLIAKFGLPALMSIIAGALGQIGGPAATGASEAIGKVDAAIKSGEITPAQVLEANRHAEKMAEMHMQRESAALSEINQTIRADAVSADPYVRRMRPTFGYLMAITWAAQMLGLAYVIVFQTAQAGFVLQAMSNLSAIWGIGLSVLGIYVYKRSEEKKAASANEAIYWSTPKGSAP